MLSLKTRIKVDCGYIEYEYRPSADPYHGPHVVRHTSGCSRSASTKSFKLHGAAFNEINRWRDIPEVKELIQYLASQVKGPWHR